MAFVCRAWAEDWNGIVRLLWLVAVLLLVAQTAGQATENKHAVAVIIGNQTYTSTHNVDFAQNDAAAVRKFVLEVLGYREGNVIHLKNATKATIEGLFGNKETHEGKLFDWIRPGKSDVLVFYSGHGVPGLKDKRAYLLPVDGDPNRAEITGYPVETLYSNLAKIPAKSVTVYLDACFSGESPKGMIVQATSGISITPKLPTSKAISILTAAQGDQFASWDEDAKHGLFTKHLLEALYGAADKGDVGNQDGEVTVAEVKRYLDEEMSYQARRKWGRRQQASVRGQGSVVLASVVSRGGLQTPSAAVKVEEMDATFVALKTANLRAGPSTKTKITGQMKAGSGVVVTGKVEGGKWYRVQPQGGVEAFVFGTLVKPVDGADLAEWQRVKDSSDVLDFKRYLAKFPAGQFAGTAKRLVKALEPKRQVASTTVPPRAATPSLVKPAVGVFPNMKPGTVFKDCDVCPEMVVIPDGTFMMGSVGEALFFDGQKKEAPRHKVSINSFAMGKYEITYSEWDACVTDGACPSKGSMEERMNGSRKPFDFADWDEAQVFVKWLTRRTKQSYRLPSEAEWEYSARAGTITKYWWGNEVGINNLKCSGEGCSKKGGFDTIPVGSFKPNPFGLFDLHGNISEWVQDCWHGTYDGAPVNGSAWITFVGGDCSLRVVRGGSYNASPSNHRSAARFRESKNSRSMIGFRVARSLAH